MNNFIAVSFMIMTMNFYNVLKFEKKNHIMIQDGTH